MPPTDAPAEKKKKKNKATPGAVLAAAVPQAGGEFVPLPAEVTWPSAICRALQPSSKKELWLFQVPANLDVTALDGVHIDLAHGEPITVGEELYAVLDNTTTLKVSGTQAAALCRGPDGEQATRPFNKFLTLANGVLVPEIAAPPVRNEIIVPPACTTSEDRFQWQPFGTSGPGLPEIAAPAPPATTPAKKAKKEKKQADPPTPAKSAVKDKASKVRTAADNDEDVPAAAPPAKKRRKSAAANVE